MTALLPLMAPGLMSDNERMVESGYWMGLTMLWKTLGWGRIVMPGQMREDTVTRSEDRISANKMKP